MPRGTTSKVGDTNVSDNGYHYTRTDKGWVLTHRIIAEKKLGRPLQANERASFLDGDKTNLEPSNIIVTIKRTASLRARKAKIEVRIRELQIELEAIKQKLKAQSS